MKKLLIMAALIAVAADGPPRVTQFVREMIATYTEAGEPLGREPKWDLHGGAAIVKITPDGHFGIVHNGHIVFVRSGDVIAENIPSICGGTDDLARSSTQHLTASAGVRSGMSGTNQDCVR